MTRRASSAVVLAGAGAYFVDMFLRWTDRGRDGFVTLGAETGWDTGIAVFSGSTALALALVELAAVTGAWRSRAQRLLAFFLAAATGVFAVGAIVHLRWGGGLAVGRFGDLAPGAWIALGLGAVLVAVAGVELRALSRDGRASASTASPPG